MLIRRFVPLSQGPAGPTLLKAAHGPYGARADAAEKVGALQEPGGAPGGACPPPEVKRLAHDSRPPTPITEKPDLKPGQLEPGRQESSTDKVCSSPQQFILYDDGHPRSVSSSSEASLGSASPTPRSESGAEDRVREKP